MRFAFAFLFAWLLLAPPACPDTSPCGTAAFLDIDVGVPPGTPLEWDKDLHQPVPTGGRHAVPTTDKAPEAKASDPKAPPSKGSGNTVAMEKRTPIDYGVTNLYQYFGITTHDIMKHIHVECPGGGLTYKGDAVATGGGESGVKWVYPPEHPVELVWIGVAGCLRVILHPEMVSVPETVAYLCEVGEPSLIGAKNMEGPVGVRIKKLVTPIPEQMPPVKASTNGFEAMVNRLVCVELTSGFPHALDPTYARHSLSLGDDAYKAVFDYTKSNHLFLARNATAVLGNFRNPEVVGELRKLMTSNDPVIRYRALTAIARKRDAGSVPTLITGLGSNDEVWRAACAYTLGVIGDSKAIQPLMKAAANADLDFLWSILPAVARLSTPNKKEYEDFFNNQERRLEQWKAEKQPDPPGVGGTPVPPGSNTNMPLVPPKPEPAGTKIKILIEICRLGLAMCWNESAVSQMKSKFDKDGIEAFFVPNQILVCNVFAKIKDGKDALKKIVEKAKADRVANQALLDLHDLTPETDWLKTQAESHRVAAVKVLALTELFDRGEDIFAPVAQRIIDGYTGGKDGAQAYVVGAALQLMGKTSKGNKIESVIKVVTSAHAAGAWAQREGDNDPDITKANIKVTPPLLEIACIELGRTGNQKGLDILFKVLKSDAKGGRGEAALGLAAIGGPGVTDALVAALDDAKEGWVRFCAYQALKKMSGQDHFCDWLFGGASSRKPAIAKYREWAGSGK